MANEILRRLTGGGRTGVFLSALVVVLIALFLPGWLGAIAVLAIVGGLGWLLPLARSWNPDRARATLPFQDPGQIQDTRRAR